MSTQPEKKLTRRSFLACGLRLAAFGALGGLAIKLLARSDFLCPSGGCAACASAAACGIRYGAKPLWQIDPDQCIHCGRCATACVLNPSAVKCVHSFDLCGYCELCGGYYRPEAKILDTGGEHQLCPTAAIRRKFVEEPYFEYTIDREACIGCSKCAKGCEAFGNGSLYLQIQHDLCKHCNECAIAVACPAHAIRRVSSSNPYMLRG